MCEYHQVNLVDSEEKISEWIGLGTSNTLILSFVDDVKSSLHFNPNKKLDECNWLGSDLLEVIEEIQMNIRSTDFPEHILITFKNRNKNPENENMTQWDNESVENYGYWYLVAQKTNITI